MSDQVVVTKDEDRVRVITINRPQALNSMNNAVFGGIRDALAEAETDDQVAVAVITGEGRAFSAGQDLQEMQDGLSGDDGAEHLFPSMLKLFLTMMALLFTIAWCQSKPKLEPQPQKKKMPDTDVERWRKEMVKHWRN